MNLPILALIGAGAFALWQGSKKQDAAKSNYWLDRVLRPLNNLFIEYHSNSILNIENIKEHHIVCNTPFQDLYGICILSSENIQKFLRREFIEALIRDNKEFDDALFYYVLHRQGHFQKQYILTHNKVIAKTFADYFASPLLSGLELTNVLYNQYLQNNFYIDNKQLKQVLNIQKDSLEAEPEFVTFKRVAKQAIAKDYKEVDIFQAFKHLDVKQSDISSVFNLKFNGSIWFYIDISEFHIKQHITKLINYSKLVGNKKPFVELQDSYNAKEADLAIVNAVAYLKDYDDEVLGALGSNLKVAFIAKEINRSQHLQKNPIKFRDSEFDFLVKSDFLCDFIASVHKKDTDKPDIYGIDKNGAFINYSFSKENDNPHLCLIAKPGSGKSVSKQKIMAQMIGLNFVNGECSNLGTEPGNTRIRSYDIGFSDEKFINLIKGNPKNKVAHIESDLYSFSYNLANLPDPDKNPEIFEADMQFNIDLISIILQSQNSEALTISEAAFLKEIFFKIYRRKEYQPYRILELQGKDETSYNKLLELGYSKSTFLKDIKEDGFEHLKVPKLIDIVAYAEKEGQNMQYKEKDREDYRTLAGKLSAIEKLNIFSDFDKISIDDVDVLSMDLNNFKESSLFTPIFLSIFQKVYLKDREFALWCKRNNRPAPKLFYAIEEAKNYFVVPYFERMLEKVALEARKYNVHLCFVVQNAEHIPKGILKNLDTRFFLLRPDKKLEVIQEVKDNLDIPTNLEIGLLNTGKHELCVWYSSGVFNMKFEISPEEMKVFSTNPNEV